MSEPWFSSLVAWIPGTFFGVGFGVLGAATGILAPRGKGRTWIRGFQILMTAASTAFLGAGITALTTQQPYAVWYPLFLPGAMGIGFSIPGWMLISRAYQQAEERRIAAQDL